jgi:hypothetical protein
LGVHLGAHTCNAYDPAFDDAEQRGVWFTDRFQAHEEAELFANNQVKKLDQNAQKVADRLFFVTDDELETLFAATEELVGARQFLKRSYVEAWAERDDASKRTLLASSQATLEFVTERLSQMTQTDLPAVYTKGGERSIRMHFRAMEFLRSTIVKYKERVVFQVHRTNEM